ncbi:mitochondrial carrier [Saccharata proteae CBS 121410]|uniref:Mitochondrial carrier n=1 Tax=Saccharata proteae CBS 121410 TaxID=1314787 RepID=A0A9P4HV23_9PEZI|nr:mitochondrial carrier [Saccharata proteae CBS 121410]
MSADFWAGYLSGAASIVLGNPLDVLKVRLQAGPPHHAPEHPAATRQGSLAHLDRLSTLARGAAAPILGYGALNALLFVSYNRTLNLLGEPDPSAPSSLWKVFGAGAVGGLATFFVSAPTELIKCRVQATQGSPSSWTVAKETWRTEGLRGLYCGGGVTSVRDSVGYAFYFWSYELSKRALAASDGSDRQAALNVLLCGGIAGVVTWASIFPLDVIKTRTQLFQTQNVRPEQHAPAAGATEQSRLLQAPAAGSAQRQGAWEIAKSAYRAEGPSVFFRGLGICSVRAFIVNAVQWAVYEWMMRVMTKE